MKSAFMKPSELGIIEISKEEYIKACNEGLEIMAISSVGSGRPSAPKQDDVIMVNMCKPGTTDAYVSYTKLGDGFIFTKGYSWSSTPLKRI
jgi:hypothetical protein